MGIMDKAKRMIDQRGGTERLKQDAGSIKGIAKGRGTASEKAKRALDTVKQPAGAGSRPAPGSTHDDRPASDRPGTPPASDRPSSPAASDPSRR
jgi:hypothetical protein